MDALTQIAEARFAALPGALRAAARLERLGDGVPALVIHPDWTSVRGVVVWMHGRTVDKFLDSGRYLRLLRAGIAACAVDLPGHGERFDASMQSGGRTLDAVAQMVGEIDGVAAELVGGRFRSAFDKNRIAIAGMSAGGMVTLRRLCDAHGFAAAAVESTAGNLGLLYDPQRGGSAARSGAARYPAEVVERLDPMQNLQGWEPTPLLALHSEADATVPVECIASFIGGVRGRQGDAETTLKTWPETGAPDEHNGFGRVAGEAKSIFVGFMKKYIGGE
ncbi:hypothetical protein BH11PLA1_BH11PLA1_08670 [soil metagenome]